MTIEDRFTGVTSHNIGDFFTKFTSFVSNDFQTFIDYYSGNVGINQEALDNLGALADTAKDISGAFVIYKDQLSDTSEYFLLLERFEQVSNKIDTVNNLSKWMRSSITNTYTEEVEEDYVLKQNETIESVARKLGYTDPGNAWANIAIRSDLREEDYSRDGGSILKVSLQNNRAANVTTVLGPLSGDLIYGTDLCRKVEFVDNDIKVLTQKETIVQSFGIIIGLRRGQVPEFPLDGLDKSAVVGNNIASVMYPAVFRQVQQLIQKNDSFSELALIDIKTEGDAGTIVVQATTKRGENITGDIKI
jgi:hypothetical protein